jgi:hypothetical protein
MGNCCAEKALIHRREDAKGADSRREVRVLFGGDFTGVSW